MLDLWAFYWRVKSILIFGCRRLSGHIWMLGAFFTSLVHVLSIKEALAGMGLNGCILEISIENVLLIIWPRRVLLHVLNGIPWAFKIAVSQLLFPLRCHQELQRCFWALHLVVFDVWLWALCLLWRLEAVSNIWSSFCWCLGKINHWCLRIFGRWWN